jgi:uncharacterized protein YndB with AHSA1/START domain
METKEVITVETVINANVEKVWEYWTKPEHLTHWVFASDDWHAPYADNDLCIGGKFKTTQNSIEMQKGGWQSILDNFKKYTEAN